MPNTIEPVITRISTTQTEPTDIVTVAEVGEWLNLSSSMVTARTSMIEALIETAFETAEGYTWLSILRRTFIAEYELRSGSFSGLFDGSMKLGLTRAPILDLDDISLIEYLDDNDVYVTFDRGTKTVDGLYENTTERQEQRQWASVYFIEDVPFQNRINAYKIRVTFDAGYADKAGTPASLKTAIKMMVASDYTNRGDCGCDCNGYPVPCAAKANLDRWALNKTVFAGQMGGYGYGY